MAGFKQEFLFDNGPMAKDLHQVLPELGAEFVDRVEIM
jgi:hypothetical protein